MGSRRGIWGGMEIRIFKNEVGPWKVLGSGSLFRA